ncbi:pyridoxal phosphate-dependent aminotransferase [Sphingomonas sp. MMS24-J13]|uniref:pyridoxal phosphate-dependent aminotransferase n=1 Tax=Sphingomonas sp. MMS24-J13 TaxID=3238686 RepID=UPI003850F711
MDLPPFLLDQWTARFASASPPIACNLASSTGPGWTLRELAALGDSPLDLTDTPLGYSSAEGSRALRAAIAALHGADPDWVVVTTGGSEALSLLFCVLEQPGASIALPDPGYPAYAAMAMAWRLDAQPYRLAREAGYVQSADAVLSAVGERTAAVVVNTPHNPTGSVMKRDELSRLATELSGRGIPLIVDEVFHPIYFGSAQPSAADIDNVVVVGDMSKALSLPGLRLGWIIDRDAERRARLIGARSYFAISHSPLLERLAAHALANAPAILGRAQAVADANLAALEAMVARSEGRMAWVRPAGGTTAFPWFTDGRDSRRLCDAAARQGVLVVPGDCFGRPDHVRIGFASQVGGLDHALEIVGSLV